MDPPVVILGIPYDGDSSFLEGCSEGPARIRKALHCASSNLSTESGIELEHHPRLLDGGDIELPAGCEPRRQIESAVCRQLSGNAAVMSLGGDHSISYPILRAYASRFGPINLLQLDAHPDLYDQLDGNRFSHACPFARAHEDGLIERHIQVGIRTMNRHQQEQANRFGVEVVSMSQLSDRPIRFRGPFYLTLDLDVLDPGFAPGVSHYEPGGMSVRQVLDLLGEVEGEMVGADVVELNPRRDVNGMTAMVAAKFVKEILGILLTRQVEQNTGSA